MEYVLYTALALLGLLFILLLTAVIIAALSGKKLPPQDNYQTPLPRQDEYARKLSQMLKFETVATTAGGSQKQFDDYYQKLQELFPLFFQKSQRIEVDLAYFFLIEGSQKKENPHLVMAHSDVVRAEGEWKYPPFSGTVAEDKIYGRGSQDIKGMLFTILQSLENLLQNGWTPQNDLYILSGMDEEVGGIGAKNCAKWFKEQGITLESVLDEGGTITNKIFPTINNDIALMGMGEKGYIDIKFTAKRKGGHSSAPRKDNAVAALAKFINYCCTHKIFKAHYLPVIRETFAAIAPYCAFPLRIVLCNLWFFGGLVKRILPMISGQVGALISSNIAFTVLEGSKSNNVLPPSASAVANIRYLNDENAEEIIDKLTKTAKKFGIESEVILVKRASSITPTNSPQFALLKSLTEKHMPSTISTPYLMIGATDSCAFDGVSKQTVRLCPIRVSNKQLNTVHAPDENIGVTELAKGVEFIQDYLQIK